MFYCLDIETLSLEQTAVVLSIGIVAVTDYEPKTYEEIMANSLYVKLDSMHQIKSLGRSVDKNTLEWWKKQIPIVRDTALKPAAFDVKPPEAFDKIRKFVFDISGQKKTECWTRGSMDVMVLEHLASQVDKKLPWEYNQFRDVRTGIAVLYENSKDGYVEVDEKLCPGYDAAEKYKHHPVHDA